MKLRSAQALCAGLLLACALKGAPALAAGKGPEEITVQYRVIAAGSVVEERCFSGTPNEMVTMFYDKDGKLAMTHYCMLGNRPTMTVKSSDAKSISFQLDKDSSCIDCAKEAH